MRVVEVRDLSALRVFDAVDRYARDRRIRGTRPAPMTPVRFSVVARLVGGALRAIEPPLSLHIVNSPSGYGLFYGQQRLPTGELTAVRLDPGTYVIRADSIPLEALRRVPNDRGPYQQVELNVVFPAPPPPARPAAVEFLLPPGPAYPFPRTSTVPGMTGPTLLRGSFRRMDGVSVEGTVVQSPGRSLYDCRLGEDGEWVLVFPDDQPDQQLTVRFTPPGGGVPQDVLGVDVKQGKENSLRQTALRGWVLTEGGAGIEGARVQVSGQAGEATTDVGGAWFFYLGLGPVQALPVTVAAIHPDGRTLTKPNIPVQSRATVPVDPFRFP